MEEMEELRKDFKKMIIEDQDKKKKKFKNFESNKKQNTPVVVTEAESTEDRLQRFDITLEENETMTKIGIIEAVVNDRILIQSVNNLKLEPENYLFARNRQILGKIEEILGSVKNPKYLVKIDNYLKQKVDHEKYAENSTKEISAKEGEPIFAVSRLMLIMNQDRIEAMSSTKGTDYDPNSVFGISQMNDPDINYSDDETQSKVAYRPRNHRRGKSRGKRRKYSNSNMSVMSTQSVPLQPVQPIPNLQMQPMPGMAPQGAFMLPNFQAFAMGPGGFVMPVYQPQPGMFARNANPAGYAAMSNQINQMYGYNVARNGDISQPKKDN